MRGRGLLKIDTIEVMTEMSAKGVFPVPEREGGGGKEGGMTYERGRNSRSDRRVLPAV